MEHSRTSPWVSRINNTDHYDFSLLHSTLLWKIRRNNFRCAQTPQSPTDHHSTVRVPARTVMSRLDSGEALSPLQARSTSLSSRSTDGEYGPSLQQKEESRPPQPAGSKEETFLRATEGEVRCQLFMRKVLSPPTISIGSTCSITMSNPTVPSKPTTLAQHICKCRPSRAT